MIMTILGELEEGMEVYSIEFGYGIVIGTIPEIEFCIKVRFKTGGVNAVETYTIEGKRYKIYNRTLYLKPPSFGESNSWIPDFSNSKEGDEVFHVSKGEERIVKIKQVTSFRIQVGTLWFNYEGFRLDEVCLHPELFKSYTQFKEYWAEYERNQK